MATFSVCGELRSDEDDNRFQAALADHYHNRKGEQPACHCQDPPIALYIARMGDRYVLKRWPNTGWQHRYTCPKYEPPAEASGLGSLLGGAIREEPLTGLTSLTVDFSLKKVKRADGAASATLSPDEAATDGPSSDSGNSRKLTLKSILHYLWDKAEFCRWVPMMADRRNWAVVAKHVQEVANGTQIKQQALGHLLYIPPVWNQAESDRLKARRQAFFGAFHSRTGPKRLVMVLGEAKELSASQFGQRLVIKSMPETRIFLSDQKYAQFANRYGFELTSWRENANGSEGSKGHHLVVLLTAAVSESGALLVEDIAAIAVNSQWIPYSSLHDRLVIDSAVALRRKFLKPMTYNLGKGRTLPSIILVDTKPLQVNVFVKTAFDSEVLNRTRDELINTSRGHSLVWETDSGEGVYDLIEGLGRTAPELTE